MTTDFFKGKTVLITGGTGSFGKNFAKHLQKNSGLKKLIIFSRDEFKQSELKKEFKTEGLGVEGVRFFIGDVRDIARLERAFHGVNIVVHAAALKQVDTLEYNPFEAVKTNIIGSQNVIEAAVNQGVKQVLLISTDKAALPVSLYGASKLCAEKLFVSANAYSGGRTKFSVVRYGNVLGSRGSIVEILLKNPNQDTVYITHEDMTRFWIDFGQSIKLVNFALENMKGGEIFVPKIPSMKVIDIFKKLAPKAKKKIIGIRPGEKIHEVLVTKEEARHTLMLPNHFVILPENDEIFSVDKMLKHYLAMGGRRLLKEFSYESDTNTDWVKNFDFRKIIIS